VSDEQGDLLDFGPARPRRPGWRIGVWAAVALAVVAGIVVRLWPHHDAARGPVATSPTTSPYFVVPPEPLPGATPRWPTAAGPCGDVDLPIVSANPVHRTTGIRLLVGGSDLFEVSFDSGSAAPVSRVHLQPDEYVTSVAVADQTYAMIATCEPNSARLLRVGPGGSSVETSGASAIFTDGARGWTVVEPDDPAGKALLMRLDGGPIVPLPPGFAPAALVDGLVVGNLIPATPDNGNEPTDLVLVDAANGDIRTHLGPGSLLAAGHGMVFWTAGCAITSGKPCTVRRLSIHDGTTASWRLPRPTGFSYTAISPDGQRLAFTLERAGQDPRYDQGHPIPPTDVAMLSLPTGQLQIVPGVELPGKSAPGLVFSSDSAWLVIGLNAGPTTRLLAWQPGLAQPLESSYAASPSLATPAMVALP
jgi:hypothetical protein